MPRLKGSGKFGPVRSLRLPLQLEEWLDRRMHDERQRPVSDILLEAVHGGLRLNPGYMVRHRRTLELLVRSGDRARYTSYMLALDESFGSEYVRHLIAWLAADEVLVPGAPDAPEFSLASAKRSD